MIQVQLPIGPDRGAHCINRTLVDFQELHRHVCWQRFVFFLPISIVFRLSHFVIDLHFATSWSTDFHQFRYQPFRWSSRLCFHRSPRVSIYNFLFRKFDSEVHMIRFIWFFEYLPDHDDQQRLAIGLQQYLDGIIVMQGIGCFFHGTFRCSYFHLHFFSPRRFDIRLSDSTFGWLYQISSSLIR